MELEKILLPEMDNEVVANEIGDFIIENVKSVGARGCVIGLSGGVDSTVVAALTKRAFDRYNAEHEDKLELASYMLPSKINSSDDSIDARCVAEKLGIRYKVHSIEPIVEAYKHTNPEVFFTKYDKGNMTSRIRANVLSTKAATEHKLVVGTGNKDEDYGIGYYTLFGDGAVHLSPIGGLSKRLVRQMARYLGFDEIAERTPTAGLEPGQTDFKDLGYDYDIVELVIEGKDQGFLKEDLYVHPQITSKVAEQKKTYENMYGASKFSSAKEIVNDVLGRHYNIALQKFKILSPDIAKVTLGYAA